MTAVRLPRRSAGVWSINQSISPIQFVEKYNKHWTGHQGIMQHPLTGARKTMLVGLRATTDNT